MKKILLILALALVCSFNANAQTNGEELVKATKKRVVTAEDAVAKEATKEVKVVDEKAYAEEAVKEAVAIPSDKQEKLEVSEDFKKLISDKREALPAKEVAKEFEAVAVPAEEVFARKAEFVEEEDYAEEMVEEAVAAEAAPVANSSEPCVTYTAKQALDATIDGNNNTFAAVYSTNATRRCGGNKIDEAAPVLKMETRDAR
ncbi:MAG: hypothetical protein II085_00765 [Alphaproteobacteria bacterium]|nr:hypothetical protein [Alphaproteobacteria bacterium]